MLSGIGFAGKYGEPTACDTPLSTVIATFDFMNKTYHNPDFVLYTGDTVFICSAQFLLDPTCLFSRKRPEQIGRVRLRAQHYCFASRIFSTIQILSYFWQSRYLPSLSSLEPLFSLICFSISHQMSRTIGSTRNLRESGSRFILSKR
jgi:hypothetical protein